uniref:Uncharacterized protein n=1 Tax=Manihot esculenta TaxID=3983 RepID=A0A2C9VW76_MANES
MRSEATRVLMVSAKTSTSFYGQERLLFRGTLDLEQSASQAAGSIKREVMGFCCNRIYF